MKEIMAFIRLNKISKSKEALAQAGFPSFTCRKVLGRGSKQLEFSMVQDLLEVAGSSNPLVAEHLSESNRLISKRAMTLIVEDDEVKKVVDILINVNSTGNHGDGKIFVMPVQEAYRVSTGEAAADAY